MQSQTRTVKTNQYILGIDLGTASVGWALLNPRNKKRNAIVDIGVHCFDAGVEGDIESGKDSSRASARREARQPRRQTDRRTRRRQKLLRLLQKNGLIPPGPTDTPQAIHELLLQLDADLRSKHDITSDPVRAHMLPYILRAKALDEQLQPFEFGRALYHLAHRRGYLSNRKTDRTAKDKGVVESGISELSDAIEAAGARTLGEYFSMINPEGEKRIRARWTSRAMYQHEFNQIWDSQARFSNTLSPQLREQVYDVIFSQRPLKSQKHLLGECQLVPGDKRAPFALRIAQRFRMHQCVNNLTVIDPDGREHPLSQEQRDQLINALDTLGDIKYSDLRGKKYFALPKGSTFNYEQAGEKTILGNRTDAALAKIFGKRWPDITEDQRDQIVDDILTFERTEPLIRKAKRQWDLDHDAALALAELSLEPTYCNHCRKALHTLVPLMADGTPYSTAKKKAYPDSISSTEPIDLLPPVLDSVSNLRNPAVCRSLTELRKVVNEVIRTHGKPATIRIELARDLKRPRKQREELSRLNKKRQAERAKAATAILKEAGIQNPAGREIEKWLLAEECNWRCPFTGKPISPKSLFGSAPQFDVEHILPMSRSLDNSFANKTLCHHEENRNRKKNLTPFEAYSKHEQRYEEILERVRRFQGGFARAKLRRFLTEEIPDDLADRQLNDTRYASRLAGEYLGLLYGGRYDNKGKTHIQTNTGQITAYLRNEWSLNSILGDGGQKSRDDHRHHAVDAIAIALSSPAIIATLQAAAANAHKSGRRLFGKIEQPWVGFIEHVRKSVDDINVSRRLTRKINGPLHGDTLFSNPIHTKAGTVHHIRKELHKLSTTEITSDRIVDPIVRALVKDQYEKLGGGDPQKVFADPHNHPYLQSKSGRRTPIHKVRIRAKAKPELIAEDSKQHAKSPQQRYVAPTGGSNHHTVIVASLDKSGNDTKWDDHPVSRLDINKRRQTGDAIVRKDWGPSQRFVFSLVPNDYIIMDDNDGQPRLYRVASISKGDLEFRLHNDARKRDEVRKAKQRVRGGAEKLRKLNARKVRVTYLGKIIPAND